MSADRPTFVGGPRDGQAIEDRFPPGHTHHGKLPSVVRVPTNSPPASPGPMHRYEYIGGQYVYQGTDDA